MKKFTFIIAAAAIVGSLAASSCGNSAKKETKEAEETKESIAKATPAPIELGPDDILEFGGAQPYPVVVDFRADWCPSCKKFSPIFHKVAEKYHGKVKFISVNVDKCPGIAKQYGVSSIPTILFVNTEGVINRSVGFMTEEQVIENVESIMPDTTPKIAPR